MIPRRGRREGREKIALFTTRGEIPLNRDYAQNLWDGCFRGGDSESCSPVDPSRMSRMADWPGNDEDTGVQTRDCARFKSTGAPRSRQGLLPAFTGDSGFSAGV